MRTPIKFRMALTKADFVKASRGYLLSQVNNQIFGVLLVLLILAGMLGLIRNGIEPSILIFVILAAVGLIYTYFLGPVIGASTMMQNSGWSSGYEWSVSQDQIIINTRAVGAKADWNLFQDFVETRDYFLLIHAANKRSFQVIPKRVFKSHEQEEAFRQLLQQRYENQRKPPIIRKQILMMLVLVLVLVNVLAMYILGNNR